MTISLQYDPYPYHIVSSSWRFAGIGEEVRGEDTGYLFRKTSEDTASRKGAEYVFINGRLTKKEPSIMTIVQELTDCLAAAIQRLECAGMTCPEFRKVLSRATGGSL